MADTVTSQTIINGPRNLVMKFTNLSDGTGESGVKKVDAQSAALGVTIAGQVYLPGVHLKITDIEYDIHGMGLRILWDASTPTDCLILGNTGPSGFKRFAGLTNPNAAGATGSILFTTVQPALNASYTVILYLTKGIPQF